MTLMFNDDEFCIMLQDADFPLYFKNKVHPDDYKVFNQPITKLIYHLRTNHNRLILRLSFKISENEFVPVTFICDTGAPSFIYINERTRSLIEHSIMRDDMENEFIVIGEDKKRIPLGSSPSNHPDVNIIGIRLLSYLGLFLEDDRFGFSRLIPYI